jgi:hypothetical protein
MGFNVLFNWIEFHDIHMIYGYDTNWIYGYMDILGGYHLHHELH